MANHVNEPVATPREENCSGKIAIEKPAADFWLFEAGKDQRQACHPNQEMPPGVRENREEEEPAERARPAPQPGALKADSKAVEARRSPFSWARGAFGNPSALLRVFDFGQSGKSTRLNSSHVSISYAVFCLKKKNTKYSHGWTRIQT